MRQLSFLALVALAGAIFASSASATSNYAHVYMNGSPCGACQFIVQLGNNQPRIVATGSTHSITHDYFYPPTLQYFVGSWSENAYISDGCVANTAFDNPCPVRAWARYVCPNGVSYKYSQTKVGSEWYIYAGRIVFTYWKTLTINTTGGCVTAESDA